MPDFIRESSITFLTLERAEMLVPPEFIPAYEWYQENEGKLLTGLPMGPRRPHGLPLRLASQAGIHSPSYERLPSRGAGCKKYALTIASSSQGYYQDREPFRLKDGTWLYEYCAHEAHYGEKGRINYNEYLLNCLSDGVPVGVLIKVDRRHYKVMGLAFIESFNEVTKTFHLHGPVNARNEDLGCFALVEEGDLTAEEKQRLEEWDPLLGIEDHRERTEVSRIRRQGQSRFREKLLHAYNGCCAVTGVDVAPVLQAAHVYPYRGAGSQVVSNGMLLRADIHQLYDAHLLAIEPDGYRVRLSSVIENGAYAEYDKVAMSVPDDRSLRPNQHLLEMHFNEFRIAEQSAVTV